MNLQHASLVFIVTLPLVLTTPALAVEGHDIPIRHFHIQQERYEKNGVLVSRPSPQDEKITRLLLTNRIRTLADYSGWLGKNIRYQNDGPGSAWPEPLKVLQNKSGDCEDYAVLNSQVLKVLGYKPSILSLVSARGAHAICVFEHDGYFFWFDNARLNKTTAKTLTELARDITLQYRYAYTLELDAVTRRWKVVYKRS